MIMILTHIINYSFFPTDYNQTVSNLARLGSVGFGLIPRQPFNSAQNSNNNNNNQGYPPRPTSGSSNGTTSLI